MSALRIAALIALLIAGLQVLHAEFWWRHISLYAGLWIGWICSVPVVAAVCARALWRWLTSRPERYWPPWWCKPVLLVAPAAISVALLVAYSRPVSLALEIAAGDHPPTTIERVGNRILVTGEINFGSAVRLEQALRSWPDIREVALDSPGGFVAEARRMADLIQSKSLDTRIDRECMSACVDLFAAGRVRTMRGGAVVGLHSAWTTDLSEESVRATVRANRDFERRLFERGVEPRFLRVGTSTPGHEMWLNSARQAHIAGLANRVVD